MSPAASGGENDEVDGTDSTEAGHGSAEPPVEPDATAVDARAETDPGPTPTDTHVGGDAEPGVVEAEVVEEDVVGAEGVQAQVTTEAAAAAPEASDTPVESATAAPATPPDDPAAIEPELVEPEGPAVEHLVAQLGELEARLAESEASAEAFRDQLYRKAADLENTKRRLQKQMDSIKRFGTEEVLKAFLPVVDDLERAVEHAKKSDESAADDESSALGSFVDGTEMVLRKLHGTLERFGVTQFKSLGESFDPQRHEALSQMENLDHPDGTVIVEYQTGYFHHDRLMRPALVVVGRNPEERAARAAAEAERAAAEASAEAEAEGTDAEVDPAAHEAEADSAAPAEPDPSAEGTAEPDSAGSAGDGGGDEPGEPDTEEETAT